MRLRIAAPAVAGIVVIATMTALAGEEPCKPSSLHRPGLFEYKYLDLNRIRSTLSSDGPYADHRATGQGSLEWPKGTGKTSMYSAGLYLIGIHRPSDSLRTANMDHGTEYQPGPLLETFNTSTNDDTGPVSRADDPRYRLYKIHRGDTLSEDYLEWPGDLGAPYEDLNGNGTWNPGIDRPRFYGDQQIWYVVNDVNRSLHGVAETPPIGVEVQTLCYAFDRPGPLQNTIFIDWTIINKSDARYDSVYVGLGCDPDLGTSFDDFPGCDTTLDLAYVYNSDDEDGTYGSTPPAMGVVYLQGPVIPGLPTDTARFRGGWKPGYRNLGMESFIATGCVTPPPLECPPSGYGYARVMHNYMQGLLSTGDPLRSADSSIIRHLFTGDPVSGTGDLPENFPLWEWTPRDVYFQGPGSGPFGLASGDTQHVVAAVVISQGSDRLESVRLLKEDVEIVHEAFASSGAARPERYLSVQPFSITFDSTMVGETGDTAGVVVHNVGTDTIRIFGVEPLHSNNFTISGPATPLDLATGELAQFNVIFTPADHGLILDSVAVTSSDATSLSRPVRVSGLAYTLIEAEGGVMYGVSSNLYAINPALPSATPVGPVFGNPLALTVRTATGDLYGVGNYLTDRSHLLRICSEHADVVSVCSIPLKNLRAIAFTAGDTLFAGTDLGTLYRVDPARGDTARVGDPSGERYTGFAINPVDGSLWACTGPWMGTRSDRILKVDTETGEPTLVGHVGDSLLIRSLAFGPDGTLYGLQPGGEQRLIQISTLDAHGTVIGSLGTVGLQAIAMRTDIASGVGESEEQVPVSYVLSQNYPNPFNPSTTIEFALPHAGFVTLKVYNVLGEEVATLVARDHVAGTFKAVLDASRLPSGVYFYRVSVNEFVQAKRMVLIR